jgi:UDP-4-amino-4,6-dideoxy-N-acetyl-beta-L-altrosamine transaminase
MIPYGRQNISEADIASVVEVLRSDWLTQGPVVPLFEERVARHCGVGYGVAANSATSALHMACLALGLRPGDRVWTSPITFLASANCARYCGAAVDFVDIDPRTYNISVAALAEKLDRAKRAGELPKIVIPVHLCGQSSEMEAIGALADTYGFKVIEDASHAIGAAYRNEPVGSCRFSDVTIFSFHPVKIITSGEGGMAMTNDSQVAKAMANFRSHGVTTDPAEMHSRPETEIWNYQQLVLGYNYRMTDIHAALGVSQMDRIEQFVSRRREIASRYDELLSETPLIRPWQHPDSKSSYHLYPVRIAESESGVSQKDVFLEMRRAGIGVNLHYIPVYLHPYYVSLGFGRGYCSEAERYFHESISLPIFPGLGEEQQERIASLINAMLRTQS